MESTLYPWPARCSSEAAQSFSVGRWAISFEALIDRRGAAWRCFLPSHFHSPIVRFRHSVLRLNQRTLFAEAERDHSLGGEASRHEICTNGSRPRATQPFVEVDRSRPIGTARDHHDDIALAGQTLDEIIENLF